MIRYLTIFTLLLVTEIAIALFTFHSFVRGFIGDVLVVPLLYSLIRAVTKFSVLRSVAIVLGFAFLIEILQLFHIAEMFNIQNKTFNIILGSTFDWWDLVAYCVGGILIIATEKLITKK